MPAYSLALRERVVADRAARLPPRVGVVRPGCAGSCSATERAARWRPSAARSLVPRS